MALPPDLTTFTLTFGPYHKDIRGDSVVSNLTGDLFPVDGAGRRVTLVHPESGTVLLPNAIPIEFQNGVASVSGLPHSDNPGLVPGFFRYRVVWHSPSAFNPGEKTISVSQSDGTVVDYDDTISATGVPGTEVPNRGVPSGGLPGQVLGKVGEADFDADWVGLDVSSAAFDRANHVGTQPASTISDFSQTTQELLVPYATQAQLGTYVSDDELAAALEGLSPRFITTVERTKLTGIAENATANATDEALRNRSTHTGFQPASSIDGLASVATSGNYVDLLGRPTIPPAYTDEQAQDAAAALLTGGTHTGVSVTYDDAAGLVNLAVASSGGGSASSVYPGMKPLPGEWVGLFFNNNHKGVMINDGSLDFALLPLPAGTYDAAGIRIDSPAGSAGALLRFAVYDEVSGAFGTLLAQTAAVPAETPSVYVVATFTAPLTITQGKTVWVGCTAQGGAATRPTVQKIGAGTTPGLTSVRPTATPGDDWWSTPWGPRMSGITGAFPTTPPSVSRSVWNGDVAKVFLRRSA